MKRGDVWWINFDPSIGGEIQKIHPAVVVSNDTSNKYLNRVQVVPLTSKINRVYPSETLVTIGDKKSKAMANQLSTISKLRATNQIGRLSNSDMRRVDDAIRLQLGLLSR